MKKLAIAVLLIGAVALGIWQGLLPGLDINALIKEQIEKHGSNTTGTSVTLEKVAVDLIEGKGALNGLQIANPKGYNALSAFEMQNITLDLATDSLDPVVIEELVIAAPKLTFETGQNGGGNLLDILDNIEKSLPASSEETSSKSEAEKELPKIAIEKIVLQDVALALNLTSLGLKEYQETLPTITVTDIGTPGGLPANELGKVIGKKVLKALIDQVKQKQKEKIKDKAKDKLEEKVKDKLKGLFG